MSVLIYAENKDGKFKKAAWEACSYGADLAQALGTDCVAVSIGTVAASELQLLGTYGVSKVYNVQHEKLATFAEAAYASAVAAVADKAAATLVVLAQTYNGRTLAPRLAVKLKAALLSGVIALAEKQQPQGYKVRRTAYTSKAIEELSTNHDKAIITVKNNSYKVKQNPQQAVLEDFAFAPVDKDFRSVSKQIHKASDKVSLTEADVVVSAGRGVGNENTFATNWKPIGELAELLGAATASSKPVADLDWRPHHEHVGQTGIQISPNVYIAVGISGAIQHLAGVSSSKTIIVINKDPEAPFFKAADYGVVGDAADVVPRLIEAIKAWKAKHA